MPSGAERHPLRLWFTVALLLAVFGGVALILAPVRGAIAWAGFLAFLLLPLQRRLTRRFGGRSAAAAGLLTGLAPLVLLVPMSLLGLAFANQVGSLVGPLQSGANLFDLEVLRDSVGHPRIARLTAWAGQQLNLGPDAIHAYLVGAVKRYAATMATAGGQVVMSAAGGFLRFFLMLFILFFMLRDGEAAFLRMVKLLPLDTERREALLDRLARVTRAVVYGAGATALIQGALVGTAWAVAGLPGPVVFGVLAAVFALLPIGGTGLVWVPGTLWLLAQDNVGWAVFLLASGIFVSVVDNIVRPALISHQTPVPTLLVFLGVIGGVAAFGFIGFVFGPVLLVLATEVLRFAEQQRDSWTSPTS
jgi:predicted PurR-regulated permease PerM